MILYRNIFLSIFIEQLCINNHTIFMQVEVALLGVATQEQTHKIKCYRAREGGGRPGGGGGTLYIGTYTGIHVHE